MDHQTSSTWQLKEVERQASLSRQTKVDESQTLHVEMDIMEGAINTNDMPYKAQISLLWMRSLLAAILKRGGRLRVEMQRPFVKDTTVRYQMRMPPQEGWWRWKGC
jgi:hypothetical protein